MKGLMYRGPGEIVFEDIPDARLPDARGAIVKATMCGICGSDLHPYHTDMGSSNYCMGHEAVGEVVEVGSDVRNFAVGDRVLIPASIGCGACPQCLKGSVILCETNSSFKAYGQGDPSIPGCQAEAVAVTAADNNLWRLPDEFSDELGIMLTDNIATASFCTRMGEVGPGDKVAVIGLGPVGLQTVMMARAMGAERIFGVDLVADRRKAAERLGAEPIDEPNVVEALMERTAGKGVDVALDATGGPITTRLGIDMLRRGGRFAAIGVSEQLDASFPLLTALMKNLQFRWGVCSVQAEIPHLLEKLRSQLLSADQLSAIVTHRMKLSEGAEAYRLFDRRLHGVQKVVLDPTS